MHDNNETDPVAMLAALREAVRKLRLRAQKPLSDSITHLESELSSLDTNVRERTAKSPDDNQSDLLVEIKRLAREVEELSASIDEVKSY